MKPLDEQEKLIAKTLIKYPRESDNRIGEICGVNVRTVARKRQRMEEQGILSYYTQVDLTESGTSQFNARHLYIVKFRTGMTTQKLINDIKGEPKVRNIFTEIIYESHIAEIDGHVAMLMFIEGASDREIVDIVQGQLLPSLLKNHGPDMIEEISTSRILAPVRILRNYIPFLNMKNGTMTEDWPEEAIYVGK